MSTRTDRDTTAQLTFLSDASRAIITMEHLALIGFAARLGTCVNNDATDSEDAKSVRDEAMLLMSLLTGKKASEILAEEIGVDELDRDRRKKSRPKDRDMGNFSFTFPSLSLKPYAARSDKTEIPQETDPLTSTEALAQEERNDASKDEADPPPPSQLLGRTQSIHDKDDIRDSGEAMAHNVLESFGAALIWRAKTWIKSLAHVLALKEQCRNAAQEDRTYRGEENGEDDSSHDDDEYVDDNSDLMNSREMQIIDAIVRSSEEVSVVNIKTSFRVMSTTIAGGMSHAQNFFQDSVEPAPKKMKFESLQETNNECKVTHKLIFEAIVSMTSNDGEKYKTVKLQAPGAIEGTFQNNSDGSMAEEETLTGVSIMLDTNALALSLERQSRLVVRRAAEAALMAASGIDNDKFHVHHSIISPRHVLMSPIQPQQYESDQETDEQHSLSASSSSAPSQPVDDAPGLVSSSDDGGCGSDSSAVTTLSLPSLKVAAPVTTRCPLSPSFPALLKVANAALNEEP